MNYIVVHLVKGDVAELGRYDERGQCHRAWPQHRRGAGILSATTGQLLGWREGTRALEMSRFRAYGARLAGDAATMRQTPSEVAS